MSSRRKGVPGILKSQEISKGSYRVCYNKQNNLTVLKYRGETAAKSLIAVSTAYSKSIDAVTPGPRKNKPNMLQHYELGIC